MNIRSMQKLNKEHIGVFQYKCLQWSLLIRIWVFKLCNINIYGILIKNTLWIFLWLKTFLENFFRLANFCRTNRKRSFNIEQSNLGLIFPGKKEEKLRSLWLILLQSTNWSSELSYLEPTTQFCCLATIQ